MNKKMVLLVLISFSLLLWMLGSLFIVFVKAVPEGNGVEENCLTKQDFANVASTVNVVFEEAHGGWSSSLTYSEFADYLVTHGYNVSTIDYGTTIDADALAPVDVLVVVVPALSYSTSEIDAIETWVKGGGKLLLISDWNDFAVQANTTATRFGINLPGDMIRDTDEGIAWPYYDGANLLPHPITAGVTRVKMYASDGIVSAPADEIPLIVTDSDETATWNDGSPAPGVSVMSAIEGDTAGSGKLVIITDGSLWSKTDTDEDDEINFYESDNEILALNTINWLAEYGIVEGHFFDAKIENLVDDDVDGYYGQIDLCWDADTDLAELTVFVKIYGRYEDGASQFISQDDPYTIYNYDVDWRHITLTDGATGLWDFKLELYDNATGNLLDILDYGEDPDITDISMDEDDTSCSFAEYFYSVGYTPFDSDGDGYNDAVEVKMDVDTTYNGTSTVYVDAYLIDPYDNTADLDLPQWSINGSSVEYGYAYLYVPSDSPEGWYDVELYLWDQCWNYEDNSYDSDVAYLYPPGVEYILTVQTPYDDVIVNVDGKDYTTDAHGKVQIIVWPGSCTVEVPTYIPTGSGSQGVFVQWSDGKSSNPRTIFVDSNLSLTAEYMTQYYLTVGSPYGTPGGAGWYDNGTTAYATLNTDIVDHGNETRRVFTHWSGDASGTNYAQSDPIHMGRPKTAIANWKTQYLVTFAQTGLDSTATGTVLTVNGDMKTFLDFPNTTWVDDGGSISYSYSGTVSSSTSGKRFSLVDVTGPDSSTSVTGPATVTGNYKTQYYLTMSTNFGTVTPGSGWHDAGPTVQIGASAPGVVEGEQYLWLGWTGTGTGSYSSMDNPASITLDGPITETATWNHTYTLSSSYIPPLTLSPETIKIDKTITVLGSITPAHETTVTLTYTKPDGSTFNRTVTSSSDGTFSDTYTPDAVGLWSVTASWPGDTDHHGDTSSIKEFTVKPIPPFPWEILQVILAIVGIVLTITIVGTAWVSTSRKRGRIKNLIDEIDDVYYRFKRKARRCEAELYRLRDMVLEDYKSGKITEQSYDILNERIDEYLKKL